MRKDCASVIIEKDGKILLNQRGYEPAKGKCDFVGGKVDPGESIEEAAIREAKEETGYDVVLGEKFITFDSDDNGPERLHIFLAEIAGGEELSSEEGCPVWLAAEEFTEENLAFPHTHEIFKKYFNQG